jgi:sulfate adenylyltransferase
MECTELKKQSLSWQSWTLSQRQLCDLEMLMCGAFAPLSGFLTYKDFDSVCSKSRLADGRPWPIPVVLDVTKEFADGLRYGEKIALRDVQGVMIAAFTVEDIWQSNRAEEVEQVYATLDSAHAGVKYLFNQTAPIYLGGKIEAVESPRHYDFAEIRKTPAALKTEFKKNAWEKIIAFQTRNPLHRAHFELIRIAADRCGANILIHPAVGMTKPGDIDYFTRVRCYEAVMPKFEKGKALLSLMPLAMRMAGPREALWHALIRKNYGCTHFIVGRDHASPGKDSRGTNFYESETYTKYLAEFESEIGIEIVSSPEVVYVEEEKKYFTSDAVPPGKKIKQISGTELRNALETGSDLPAWYTFPEVYTELKKTHKPAKDRGLTIFLTGLPSAGKSTIAEILLVKLLELGKQNVSLLDGDEVRKLLSSELGFSKEHRDLNIRRIGFVASEITKNGGIAICAPIAPYDEIRKEVRELIEKSGKFCLVYVNTPLEVCEKRDRKGLYAKAKAGLVKCFTGIDDPYEVPHDADLIVETTKLSAAEAADSVIATLNLSLL